MQAIGAERLVVRNILILGGLLTFCRSPREFAGPLFVPLVLAPSNRYHSLVHYFITRDARRDMKRLVSFLLCGVALIVTVISIIWSLWITQTLDKYAEEFAIREMPGFELTADILGREVIISDAYRFSSFPGLNFEERLMLPPEGLLAAIVRSNESSGMRAATLYFRAGPGKMKRYSVDFPGC